MNLDLVKKIADAVLYEGYILYPYRASAVKNRQRFNWGVLTPQTYSEAQNGTERWQMQTEVLVLANKNTGINLKIRFLHLLEREIFEFNELTDENSKVGFLKVGEKIFQTWQEAIEREVNVSFQVVNNSNKTTEFSFPANNQIENIPDEKGNIVGKIVRHQELIEGKIELFCKEQNYEADSADQKLFKLTALVSNQTCFQNAGQKSRDQALAQSLISAHIILSVENGQFISLLEPPEKLSKAAANCTNIGTYPILVGFKDERDCLLSSPIILYDYPEIAPESPGDLFDGGEIDEILTLRILTMTDEEKREMLSIDAQTRKILERSENLSAEQFMKMHGVLHKPGAVR